MNKMPDGRPVEHLGDGVYAIYEEGIGIWLHANSQDNPTDRIWLDNYVLDALPRFIAACKKNS